MRSIAVPASAAAVTATTPVSSQITEASQILKAQAAAKDHQEALAEEHALMLGLAALQPAWSRLPLGPYPATSDPPPFPAGSCPSGSYPNPTGQDSFNCVVGSAPPPVVYTRTGDSNFVTLSKFTISDQQRAEPAAVAQGIVDQAAARTPKLTGMFWLGIACLGAGIYVYRKR